MLYRLANAAEVPESEARGSYTGGQLDKSSGFLHLSTAQQVVETAARYFAGATDLVLLTFDAAKLSAAPGRQLRWEDAAPPPGAVKRLGAFPHLYGVGGAPWQALARVPEPLPLDSDGKHSFPLLAASPVACNLSWPPLESDPEIYTELLKRLGLDGWSFSELLSLSDASPPGAVAFIVCYHATEDILATLRDGPGALSSDHFFLKQTSGLDAACGLVACLHAVANVPSCLQDCRGKLSDFLHRVSKVQSAEHKGVELEKDAGTHEVYLELASKGQSEMPDDEEDVRCHYITLLPGINDTLLLFDGEQESPLVLPKDDASPTWQVAACQWLLTSMVPAVQSGAISVLALVKDEAPA